MIIFTIEKKATGNFREKPPKYTIKSCSKCETKQHNFEQFVERMKRGTM